MSTVLITPNHKELPVSTEPDEMNLPLVLSHEALPNLKQLVQIELEQVRKNALLAEQISPEAKAEVAYAMTRLEALAVELDKLDLVEAHALSTAGLLVSKFRKYGQKVRAHAWRTRAGRKAEDNRSRLTVRRPTKAVA